MATQHESREAGNGGLWRDFHRDTIARPIRLTRSISIRAIARSLQEPHATVQRHVHKLRATGLMVDIGSGYAISNDSAHAVTVIGLLEKAHDSLIRLIEDFWPEGSLSGNPGTPGSGLLAATIAASLDIWLIPFELAHRPVADGTSKLVWIAIAVGNVRHVTTDPALSELYADRPTPDELRHPLDVRRITSITRLGYGTVYRHCRKLARIGVIKYDRGGWLIAANQLDKDQVRRGVEALLEYYCKRINELVAMGLDPARAVAYYRYGRSDYLHIRKTDAMPNSLAPVPVPLSIGDDRRPSTGTMAILSLGGEDAGR